MTQSDQHDALAMMNKVPAVTIFFWIIKILATTVGETAADFLSVRLDLGLSNTSYITIALLVAALVYQLRQRRYVAWAYWVSVVLISIAGTLITDKLVDDLGVSLETTTAAFAIALALTFAVWYAAEKTLSIHTIYTTRRELFYWLAILFTFALGTAAGDLAAEGLDLGFGQSAVIFGALIALVTGAHFFLKLDPVLSFWIAYILTRPLGASCGDLLSQPVDNGGLGLGTLYTSGLFLAVIVVLVLYLTVSRRDVDTAPQAQNG